MIIFKKISSILYSPRFLLVTNTTTGVIFFGTGDVCIQKLIERKKQVERKRLGRVTEFSQFGFLQIR